MNPDKKAELEKLWADEHSLTKRERTRLRKLIAEEKVEQAIAKAQGQ